MSSTYSLFVHDCTAVYLIHTSHDCRCLPALTPQQTCKLHLMAMYYIPQDHGLISPRPTLRDKPKRVWLKNAGWGFITLSNLKFRVDQSYICIQDVIYVQIFKGCTASIVPRRRSANPSEKV